MMNESYDHLMGYLQEIEMSKTSEEFYSYAEKIEAQLYCYLNFLKQNIDLGYYEPSNNDECEKYEIAEECDEECDDEDDNIPEMRCEYCGGGRFYY